MTRISIRSALLLSLVAGFALTLLLLGPPPGVASQPRADAEQQRASRRALP